MIAHKIALITGINGFVGPYLREELESHGYEVYGLDITGDDIASDGKKIYQCDITDTTQIEPIIRKVMPTHIFHLAGFSSVAKSFDNPELCFKINVEGTKNLLDAVVKVRINPKILIVSSAEIYGKPKYNPIDESHPLNPISPYGESRLEQEKLCQMYIERYDLPIIISRSFGHTGPTQQDTFVMPSFRKQVREAKEGDIIYVGNIEVIRDFSDVRDVVKAYVILLEKGKKGDVYNIGSGNAYLLKDFLNDLILKSEKRLTVQVDPQRYRKADVEEQVCNPKKLKHVIDFEFRKIV